MRWVVNYQKGSFTLCEAFAHRDDATSRVMALAADDSVWSVHVKDEVTGHARLVTFGSGPSPVRGPLGR
jgi:hypothetical protein